jgi:hypothetical protein
MAISTSTQTATGRGSPSSDADQPRQYLASKIRVARGRAVLMCGAVVNDRGIVNVDGHPINDSPSAGAAQVWMGDGSTPTPASNYEDRGSLTGYEGNLYALAHGLSAPTIILLVPNLEIRSAVPAAILATFTRAVATYGAFTLPAGPRVKAAGGYMIATLEDVAWTAAETGTKSVRVRQVSEPAEAPVAINTVTTFVDAPADTNVTCNTAAVTVPVSVDSVTARYLAAFNAILDAAAGMAGKNLVCDRMVAGDGDNLSSHCLTASGQGQFRTGWVAPPMGTTAADAEGAGANGVGRATLESAYVAYCHPGVQRQFPLDAANLNAASGYVTTMPSHFAAAFLAAQWRPEPARPHSVLRDYKIVGIEQLATPPDRKTHEKAFIWQPVMEHVYGQDRMQTSFHSSPMANGVEASTRRGAFDLYENYIALAAPYHKGIASQTKQDEFTGAIASFLERRVKDERLSGYLEPTGTYDGETHHFTVEIAAYEIGNMDKITFRSTFGPPAAALLS